ncbi:unnamed protein product [Rotaria sordida]|uniref:Polysaccharide pyruvyl transferase domain-containing protein n=1 Tax=Rotaria sordida TaxID=392033 RepID=A0A819BZW8_9BILA|nr:unnamed protein product [Rotaria sordida]
MKYARKIQKLFICAGLLHCIEILTMNFMLTLSNIPCVHTIRSLEPLLAGMLVYLFPMPNKTNESDKDSKIDNIERWIGTILMVLGALLATWRSGQCYLLGIIIFLGILTNLFMVIRNICIQHITVENDDIIFTQIILYGISTLLSFLLLFINDFPYLSVKKYMTILCFIGLCSFIYNSTSIIVCSRVSLVSHSLLTMLKRPTIIFASIIYFDTQISLMMIIGNIIILIGIILYKINIIALLSISRTKLYIIISSLILIFSIVIIFPPVHNYTNVNDSLRIKMVKMNKDFPLFYWRHATGVDNFGDKLSDILIKLIVGSNLSVITSDKPYSLCKKPKLLAIGSIFNFACRNDVIWGSGILDPSHFHPRLNSTLKHTLDIRAVRGPRTRNILISKFNLNVPEVYGDPALLLPYYLTSYKKLSKPTIPILIILHHADVKNKSIQFGLNGIVTANAFVPWNELLSLIVQSKLVISSSLHGIIVSEAFGISARLLKSPHFSLFKFYDYYESTNRTLRYATTIDQAINMGGEKLPNINLKPLLNAFPFDKFVTNKNS